MVKKQWLSRTTKIKYKNQNCARGIIFDLYHDYTEFRKSRPDWMAAKAYMKIVHNDFHIYHNALSQVVILSVV